MHLIVLIGPPAVGKHTVAQILSQRTGYKLFHNHLTADLALSLFDYGDEEFFPLMSDLRLRCFEAASKASIDGLIFTCAFAFPDADKFCDDIESRVSRYDGHVDYVRLTSKMEDLKKRVSNSDRKKYRKITDANKLELAIKEYNLLEVAVGRETLTISTSDMNPEEVSDKIYEIVVAQYITNGPKQC